MLPLCHNNVNDNNNNNSNEIYYHHDNNNNDDNDNNSHNNNNNNDNNDYHMIAQATATAQVASSARQTVRAEGVMAARGGNGAGCTSDLALRT